MQDYYNFTKSAEQISFDPYWYGKSNFLLKSFLGISVLALGIAASILYNLQGGVILSIFTNAVIIIHTIYIVQIKNKTTFIFDKIDNAFFEVTPFGKRKIASLDQIINIITKSGSNNFNYILTLKNKNAVKKIYLTASIKDENQNNPEIRFFELQIIPQLESFLNLSREVLIFLDSEDCSSI